MYEHRLSGAGGERAPRGWYRGAGTEGLSAQRRNQRVLHSLGAAPPYSRMALPAPLHGKGQKSPTAPCCQSPGAQGRNGTLCRSRCCQGTQRSLGKESSMPPLHFLKCIFKCALLRFTQFHRFFFLSSSPRGSKLQRELGSARGYYHSGTGDSLPVAQRGWAQPSLPRGGPAAAAG